MAGRKCQHPNYSCDFICTCECNDCDSDNSDRREERRSRSNTDNMTSLFGLAAFGIVAGELFD